MKLPGTDHSGFGEILSVRFLIFEKADIKIKYGNTPSGNEPPTADLINMGISDMMEPVVRNAVFGEDNEIKPFSPDKLYSYMLGALTAGLYNLY